jgi:hypothetical protein
MSLIETALYDYAFHDPREAATGSTNPWGDHIGHSADLAYLNRSVLAKAIPFHPTATQIEAGYGTTLVKDFLRWANQHGVRVIGGLPTGFADSPVSEASVAAIQAIYHDNGADFLALPNLSRYPREAFFDTPDHLNEPSQIAHSAAVARGLLRLTAQVTDRTPTPSR